MNKEMVVGLLLSMIAASGFASEGEGIFSFKVGQLEVHMIVEAERDGNTSIIPGASEAVISRYIPESGFKHSTNVFLIKAPGRNILVDTGFGREIFDKMKQLSVEPEQIDAVLITHLHGDHIGGLAIEGRALFPNAQIYLDTKEHEHFTKTAVNQGAVAALAPYDSRLVTFDAAAPDSTPKEILPGIYAIANYGHTPGHTVFLVEDGGEELIIAGDFLHIALVQFPNPDISATYDMDQRAAAVSRREVMDYAAKSKALLGAMHMVYPGVGTVEADGNAYRFVPAK